MRIGCRLLRFAYAYWVGVGVVFAAANASVSQPGQAGGTTTVTLQETSWSYTQNQWLVTLSMTNNTAMYVVAGHTIGDPNQSGIASGVNIAVNSGTLVAQGYANASSGGTLQVGNYGGTSSVPFTLDPAPPVPKQLNVPLINSTPCTVTYQFYDSVTGLLVGQQTVGPGGTVNYLLQNSTGANINVMYTSNNSGTDSNGNLILGNQTNGGSLGTIYYNQMQTVGTAPGVSAITAQPNNGGGSVTNLQDTTGGSNSSVPQTTIVNLFPGGTGTGTTGDTSTATNGTIAKAANVQAQQTATSGGAIVSAVQSAATTIASAVAQGSSGSTGGTGTQNVTGSVTVTNFPANQTVSGTVNVGNMPSDFPSATTHSDLNAANGHLTDIKNDLDAIKTSVAGDSTFVPSQAVSNASAAAASAIGNLPSNAWGTDSVPSTPGGVSVPSTLPDDFTVPKLYSSGTNLVLSFVPGSQLWAPAASILTDSRPILLLVMCIWFAGSAGECAGRYVRSLPTVPSQGSINGPEDIVPGVGQAKTYLAATVVVGVFAGCVAALVGLVDGMLGHVGSGIASIMGSVGLSSLGSGLALIDTYFPVGALVTLGVMRAALNYCIIPIYGVAAATVRFVVV